MNGLLKKYKFFIVCALVVLVVGMALFGIFGLNQTVDYKGGYEVRVSIDQSVGNSKSILKNSTEDYFASSDIKSSYIVQEIDDEILTATNFWGLTGQSNGMFIDAGYSNYYTRPAEKDIQTGKPVYGYYITDLSTAYNKLVDKINS